MAYTAKMLLVLGVLVGATFAETVPDPHCCRSYRDLSTIEDPRAVVEEGKGFTEIIEKLHTNFHTAPKIKSEPYECDEKIPESGGGAPTCDDRIGNLFQLSPTVGACGDPFLVGASRVCVPLCCSCCQDLKVLKINDLTLADPELVSAPESGLSLCHDLEMSVNLGEVDMGGATRYTVELADDQVELVSGATSGTIRPMNYDLYYAPLRLYCEDRCGASGEE
eukprot:777384_1